MSEMIHGTPPLTAPRQDTSAAPSRQDTSAAPSRREVRRDPAPSRLAYRVQRVWLTPLYRALIRVGIPAFGVVFAVAWFLNEQGRVEAIGNAIADMRRAVEERPEFMVTMMELGGASTAVADDIREVAPIDFPVSSFDLDLTAMQSAIEGLDAVKVASVRVRSGGILEVEVNERVPAALWFDGQAVEVLDADGHPVMPLDPGGPIPDLPRLAGAGADKAVPEALALLAAAGPVASRITGLLRVGARRWDVVLRDGPRIQLPETQPQQVLERIIALHQARDVLDRDVARIDMRLINRPTLRLNDGAMAELRHIQALEMGTGR